MGLWDLVIGDYDWTFLCTPRVPWGQAKPAPPLYKPDAQISLFVSFIMGLQHALAMVGGIITVPIILSGTFYGNFTNDQTQYVVSAALICSGLASLVQVTQFHIPLTNYVVGTGLLSVMGISFTFLPIAQSSIQVMRSCSCGSLPCQVGGSCLQCTVPLVGSCLSGADAYGKLMGTILVCCLLEIGLSFAPPKVLRKLFPPVVSGTTVILIGFALTGTGFAAWGGGNYCASQVLTSKIPCDGNGQVVLPFGSSDFVGLGFVVFCTLVLVELFGSPFMRNIQVALGLLVGMIVASSTFKTQCSQTCAPPVCPCFDVLPLGITYNNMTNMLSGIANGTFFPNATVCATTGCAPPICDLPVCLDNRYVTGEQVSNAKWITFLWVKTFKIGFYAPAVLPMLFGFMVTTMECIGDITATTEASGLIPTGEGYQRSIQGGVLSDGLSCFFGALAFTLPPTTFAQNNGIISLTRCGARRAGWACGGVLITLGVVAKFAGIILSIPSCVLGGMTTFLFINVTISGMRILTMGEGITRRNRFIAAMAMSIGIGVELVPTFVNISGQFSYPNQGNFWPIDPNWSSAMLGFRNAIIIVLSNGFSIGGFIALIMNLILPYDLPDTEETEHDTAYSTGTADRKARELEKPYDQEMEA